MFKQNQGKFQNKIAIITGSSAGIGKATALLLAKEGATVVLNGRDEAKLITTANEIKTIGNEPLIIVGDICSKETIKRIVTETSNKLGKIDILINNTGGSSPIKNLEEVTEIEWQQTIDKNLSSVFFLCQKVAPVMKKQQYGRIVNLASLAGRNIRKESIFSGPQYSAAKAGVLGLTRYLALLLAEDNITVNAVAPGITLTKRVAKRWDSCSAEEQEKMLAGIPLKRLGKPEEVAEAIVFLASDSAAYITGATIDVNGGYFMS
ncbi:MAG: SDR family oxidoreductase [Gomphosphaeria aponina SAG 52.96 = DSM 107014]|uniref:SDR family oxidoreductase n=1 Tax=Gomphosphaeria aponina SAG 52.96 = DSM 107014 TaxID=1521640 RepID=A0A941GV91_9CHRO|nr:SDR family oxidoreductase [Gomphosphaeria aponina SAG 52.96 = DSM 107014]